MHTLGYIMSCPACPSLPLELSTVVGALLHTQLHVTINALDEVGMGIGRGPILKLLGPTFVWFNGPAVYFTIMLRHGLSC